MSRMKPLNQANFQMKIIKDLGMVYINDQKTKKYRSAIFQCTKCDGNQQYTVDSARYKNTKVCLKCSYKTRSRKNKTHGDAAKNTRLYRIWTNMNHRCNSVGGRDYPAYGGRGIKIEFKSYEKFKKWALKNGYSDKLSIDRIDNDGNYSKKNCRWTNQTVQSSNKRARNKSTKYVGIVERKDRKNRYHCRVAYNKKLLLSKIFLDLEEALLYRDKFILEHDLPHTLNILSRELT